MIIDAIIYVLYGVVYLITSPLRLLSDVTLPAQITSTITAVGSNLALLDTILPVDNLLIIMGLFLTIETGIFFYKGIMWTIKKIPFIN
jgi:hypothetical protein